MTSVVGDSSSDSPHQLTTGTRHFEQAPRVDRPPPTLCYATSSTLPATQGQRWEAVREGGGGAAAASGEAPGASAGPVVAAGDGSLGCSEVAGRLLPGASGGLEGIEA